MLRALSPLLRPPAALAATTAADSMHALKPSLPKLLRLRGYEVECVMRRADKRVNGSAVSVSLLNMRSRAKGGRCGLPREPGRLHFNVVTFKRQLRRAVDRNRARRRVRAAASSVLRHHADAGAC
eukprot:PLAT8438.3.p1 GENE.PLAT8438.3~~PLAT8438.3.p1  ORF type:complete len:137 (-),score=29.20 PLAT8438.3:35-409(-)